MRGEVSIAQVFHALRRDDLLPAILFRSSRKQCDLDVQKSAGNPKLSLSQAKRQEMRAAIEEIVGKYDMDLALVTSHPQYQPLISSGFGAHHAGQLLMWRLLLEELMARGLLRILVATGTVAAGVDFPARTVVVTADSRRGAEGFQQLSASEFQQMSGRAGRRGKDTVGFCVVAPGRFCDARKILNIANREAEPLVSQYVPSPSTVLNLLRYRAVDDLRFTVSRSLAAYVNRKSADELRSSALKINDSYDGAEQESLSKEDKKTLKRARRFIRQAQELETTQEAMLEQAVAGLSELGFIEGSGLTDKGVYAANLCTSIVLDLAELIEQGLFDEVSPEYLAALVASISGDPHRGYLKTKKSPLSEKDAKLLGETIERVRSFAIPGVPEETSVLKDAANTVLIWLQADGWDEFRGVLVLSGVAEGDAARLITQTADSMNQLTRLADTHPRLAVMAERAKERLLRSPLSDVLALVE